MDGQWPTSNGVHTHPFGTHGARLSWRRQRSTAGDQRQMDQQPRNARTTENHHVEQTIVNARVRRDGVRRANVRTVGDTDHGRACTDVPMIVLDDHARASELTQKAPDRAQDAHAPATALESVEIAEQPGVKADSGGLEEVAVADLAHVHRQRLALAEHVRGQSQVAGYPEGAGDVHDAAQRHEAKHGVGVREATGDFVDSTVAARGDHELAALGDGASRQLGGVTGVLCGPVVERNAFGIQRLLDVLGCGGVGVDAELVAGIWIEDERRRLRQRAHVDLAPARRCVGCGRGGHHQNVTYSSYLVEDSAPPGQTTGRQVLEHGRRLSESMLWHLQRDLYDTQGIHAWERGSVPQSITTSPFIARAYAQITLGYLRDLAPRLDRTEPVYIVELGAGSGRFAFRFIKALERMLEKSHLHGTRFTYVMTDISPALFDFWQTHASLRPFVDAGELDFAAFDATQLGAITLRNSGVSLLPESVANPAIVIGNYFFDSIPHDSFSIQEHRLFENLVHVQADTPTARLADMNVSFDAQPVASNYYAEPELNAILEEYRARLDDSIFLMPVGGMACIRYFRELSRHGALFVLGDIGYARETDIHEYTSGGIGSDSNFWLSVNFHAVGEYVRRLGGGALHPPQRHAHLNVSSFVLGGPISAFDETSLAYEQAIGQLGPDDFWVLSTVVGARLDTLKRGELLALVRASGWDSEYFAQCLPFLLNSLSETGWTGREDIRAAVAEVWDAYYPMGDSSDAGDIPSGLGVLLYSIGDYAEALQYFQRSLELVRIDPRTTFNVALCLNRLGRQAEALEWLDRTLELDPAAEDAQALRDALTA
jgi:tetratricopeptide (TPR) repeat protein